MLHRDAVVSFPGDEVRAAILLCDDLARVGRGLDLAELRSSLAGTLANIVVEVVPGLCRDPEQVSSILADLGAARCVLGLCAGEYPQFALHAGVRKVGMDPFGLEIVPLGTWCAEVHARPQATTKASVLLAAAVARARAFAGCGPEYAQISFLPLALEEARHSLLTLPPVVYRPVPAVRQDRCAVGSGCHLCARACPRGVIEEGEGRLFIDKGRCEGCGVCLVACPQEAVDFPGQSLSQFEAQLAVLLDFASRSAEPAGLLLTCEKAAPALGELAAAGISYSSSWLPVVVPCLGMVTPGWVFQALARGAGAVGMVVCCSQCSLGQQQVISGRVGFCRRLLQQLGLPPGRVQLVSATGRAKLLGLLQRPPLGQQTRPPQMAGEVQLLDPQATAQALHHLACGLPRLADVEHEYSPFGALNFRADGCTGCLACVFSCPAGALVAEGDGDRVTIKYTGSACTGCGMCAEACPGGRDLGETGCDLGSRILEVQKITRWSLLNGGAVVLRDHGLLRCEGCGAEIAPLAMLRRLEAALDGGGEAIRLALRRYCPACRPSFVWGGEAAVPWPDEVGTGEAYK